VTDITLPNNATTAGTATAAGASTTTINFSMPYTDDANTNNNYTVEYCVTSSCSYVFFANPAAHTVSPYSDTITGLTPGETYNVRMTYNDTDGVNGTAEQIVTDITLANNATTAGTATAVAASSSTIDFSMPYTGDENTNNNYTVEYCVTSSCSYVFFANPAANTVSPYSDTIGGLTAGETYNVRMTYNDTDGVNGTAEQTVTDITLPAGAASLPSGAVAHWKFDENGGTSAADSVGSNHGTLKNSTTWEATGVSNSAGSFTADGDKVEPTAGVGTGLLDAHTAHTIEGWIKWDGTDDRDNIFLEGGTTDGYGFSIHSGSDVVRYMIRSGGALDEVTLAESAILLQQWVHFAATYDGSAGEMRVYINGQEAGSLTSGVPASIGDPGNGWRIGGQSESDVYDGTTLADQSFTGEIDELIVYNRALTASEILGRYYENVPHINSAYANDHSLDGAGIQYGDQVVFTFNVETNGPTIDAANIETVLSLSAGSWLDGSGAIGRADWSTTVNINDTLTVTLSDNTSAPTLAPGATVTLGGSLIKDSQGTVIDGAVAIGGDFGQPATPKLAVAHWRFDGSTVDSASDNDGSLVGNATYGTAKAGSQSLTVDGNGDRVVPAGTAQVLGAHTAHTLEAWVYRSTDTSSQEVVVAQGDGTNGFELNVVAGGGN
jgi:hypothetical protein